MGRPTNTQRILNSINNKRTEKFGIASTGKSDLVIPNLSGDHSKGKVLTTPTLDNHIVNKKYVDEQLSLSGGDNLGNHVATQTISGADIYATGTISGAKMFCSESISGGNFYFNGTGSGCFKLEGGEDAYGGLLTCKPDSQKKIVADFQQGGTSAGTNRATFDNKRAEGGWNNGTYIPFIYSKENGTIAAEMRLVRKVDNNYYWTWVLRDGGNMIECARLMNSGAMIFNGGGNDPVEIVDINGRCQLRDTTEGGTPSSACTMFSSGGALYVKGGSGTVTKLANA